MKRNREIAMILAVVLSIVITTIIGSNFTEFKTIKTIITNHPNKDDYKKFEEYSSTVAKGLNTEEILDKDALITQETTNDNLIVEVISKNYGYGVRSVYPIFNAINDSENIDTQSYIDLNNAKHEYYANFKAQIKNETYSILLYSCVILFIYLLLYGFLCWVLLGVLEFIENKK